MTGNTIFFLSDICIQLSRCSVSVPPIFHHTGGGLIIFTLTLGGTSIIIQILEVLVKLWKQRYLLGLSILMA